MGLSETSLFMIGGFSFVCDWFKNVKTSEVYMKWIA